MNHFAWIAIFELVSLQLVFPSVAFAYEYNLDLKNPSPETIPRTQEIAIDNCDNNQAEPYDIQNRLQISEKLSFTAGWNISPGLEVSIPGVPVSLNASTELSRTVGNESSIINETNQSLTGSVPAGAHKVIHVSIEEDLVKGKAVVSKQPSQWWEKLFPSDSLVEESPYTAYKKRRVVNISYRNISCFAGKWVLDWSQWQVKPNSFGMSPIGELAGGELNIDDNGSVNAHYVFSYWTSSGDRSQYSISCGQGSLEENGLQGVIHPMIGILSALGQQELRELQARYINDHYVHLTLCGKGKTKNTDRWEELPFQVRYQTQANNRVLIMENHETRSVWYQKK